MVNIVDEYEITPRDSHKSFYGKCSILIDEQGNKYLRSYDTIVAAMFDGELFRTWSGYSATTQRHIVAFCGMGKAEFEKVPFADYYDIQNKTRQRKQ